MTELTNHWRRQYENKYLGAWDLFDHKTQRYRTVRATVDSVNLEDVKGEGGRTTRLLVMRLSGQKGPIRTPMIITKTSGKTLEAMYGPIPQGWVGKEIVLYANMKNVRGQNAFVLTIRNERGNDQLREQMRDPEPEGAALDAADDVGDGSS